MNIRAFLIIGFAFLSTALAGPGDTHYVKTLQAPIHAQPSSDSEVKFIIAIGRKLIEFERNNDWIYVGVDKSGGKDGWIEKSKVSNTDPDGLKY